jgi:hypothetical protein
MRRLYGATSVSFDVELAAPGKLGAMLAEARGHTISLSRRCLKLPGCSKRK